MDPFVTETMAELCARQGRAAEAISIYRKLLAAGGEAERRERWSLRLESLLSDRIPGVGVGVGVGVGDPAPRQEPAPARPATTPVPAHTLPLVVRQPVRSGQVVYAPQNDLIVLAPVSGGAQLVADGNIHVYGVLRGQAMAGARGARGARIFCQRLEAELLSIDSVFVLSDDIPRERFGKAAQVSLEGDRFIVAPL